MLHNTILKAPTVNKGLNPELSTLNPIPKAPAINNALNPKPQTLKPKALSRKP